MSRAPHPDDRDLVWLLTLYYGGSVLRWASRETALEGAPDGDRVLLGLERASLDEVFSLGDTADRQPSVSFELWFESDVAAAEAGGARLSGSSAELAVVPTVDGVAAWSDRYVVLRGHVVRPSYGDVDEPVRFRVEPYERDDRAVVPSPTYRVDGTTWPTAPSESVGRTYVGVYGAPGVISDGAYVAGSPALRVEGEDGVAATGNIVVDVASASDGDTVTIDGEVLTARTSAPGANEFFIDLTDEDTAENLKDAVNTYLTTVAATRIGDTVYLEADEAGTDGNDIELATSNATAFDLSGANLSGGLDDYLTSTLLVSWGHVAADTVQVWSRSDATNDRWTGRSGTVTRTYDGRGQPVSVVTVSIFATALRKASQWLIDWRFGGGLEEGEDLGRLDRAVGWVLRRAAVPVDWGSVSSGLSAVGTLSLSGYWDDPFTPVAWVRDRLADLPVAFDEAPAGLALARVPWLATPADAVAHLVADAADGRRVVRSGPIRVVRDSRRSEVHVRWAKDLRSGEYSRLTVVRADPDAGTTEVIDTPSQQTWTSPSRVVEVELTDCYDEATAATAAAWVAWRDGEPRREVSLEFDADAHGWLQGGDIVQFTDASVSLYNCTCVVRRIARGDDAVVDADLVLLRYGREDAPEVVTLPEPEPTVTLTIAIGGDGSSSYAETTPDGTTYTAQAGPLAALFFRAEDVTYVHAALSYIAVGGTAQYCHSTTGLPGSWLKEATFGTQDLVSICTGTTLTVAVGLVGQVLSCPNADVTDGANWTSTTVGTTRFRKVFTNGTLFVAVGDSGALFTSTDGTTWTSRTSGFGSTTIRGGCWSAFLGLFVIVGDAGKIATSPDGITWTLRTSGTTQNLYTVASSDVQLCCAGGTGASNTHTRVSTDGITWNSVGGALSTFSSGLNTVTPFAAAHRVEEVAWSDAHQLWYAVGDGGCIATSASPITAIVGHNSFAAVNAPAGTGSTLLGLYAAQSIAA